MSTSALPTNSFPVFATVFCEGRSAPVFNGVTTLPLVSEGRLRNVLKQSFAHVRKVALCLLAQNTPLGAARPTPPSFFAKAGGVFHFTKEEAMSPAKPMRPTAFARAQVKAAKKSVRKKKARSLASAKKKVSRRMKGGHSTGVKAQRKRSSVR